jgi:hypothetical protein
VGKLDEALLDLGIAFLAIFLGGRLTGAGIGFLGDTNSASITCLERLNSGKTIFQPLANNKCKTRETKIAHNKRLEI